MPGLSPCAVNVSVEPGSAGVGSPAHNVEERQLDASIGKIEHRISYCSAFPVIPSSPGAVHVSVIELDVGLVAARSATESGEVTSLGGAVVSSEHPDMKMKVAKNKRNSMPGRPRNNSDLTFMDLPPSELTRLTISALRTPNASITCKGGPQSGQGARVATANRVTGDIARFMQLLGGMPQVQISLLAPIVSSAILGTHVCPVLL